MMLFLFLLGLAVGSFLNVVIDRLPNGRSIVRGRSVCDHCGKVLSWYELIPILSFFCIGGKCIHCKASLSWQYPIIETLTGLLFVGIYIFLVKSNTFEWSSFLYLLIIFSGLVSIFVTDSKYRIIPDQILICLTATVLVYMLLSQNQLFFSHLVSGAGLFLFFLFLFFMTARKGIGFGDVKYAFFMGLFLGFPATLVGFYAAFLTGAVISLILILIGKKKFRQTIPFGPFLVLATVIAYLYGEQLWYIFARFIGI